jgi:2-furoyl-CoA dehydrogenase FAD binding subunit
MKPASFDYLRPDVPEEALAALGEWGGDAQILAGGQSLMALLNFRLVRPKLLIDIGGHRALSGLRVEDGRLVVEAAVTQAALAARPSLARESPLLTLVLPWIGHYQTRNRGTVCGSIAHADPAAELPLALLALEGDVVLRTRQRRRILGADDFFRGMLSTARADDELIEAVRFPLHASATGVAFREVSQRHGDFALVACAAVAGRERLRFAVGGVAPRPTARDWPATIDGAALDDALVQFAGDLEAGDDLHASAQYRRTLVRRIGASVVKEALACRR